MRIFDNPNHPHYGPVRRMWIVLVQLDLLTSAEAYMDRFGRNWDEALVSLLERYQMQESAAQRSVLRTILEEC